MKKYNQLTSFQRYEIEELLSQLVKKTDIADQLGVHVSTIYREIKRNSDQRDKKYKHVLAERKSKERHKFKCKSIRFNDELRERVISLLKEDYSPEQITGVLALSQIHISHELIYQFVWADKKQGGKLYKHLRNNGRRYRKRGALKGSRGLIMNRVPIEKRPQIVEKKTRLGDLEVDLIIGKDHKGAIVTINDRVTGVLKMKYVSSKTAKSVGDVIINELEEWKPFIKTITSDNGKEFADHQRISEALEVDFYFANPYHSWERGANENLNGLIRQYLPKKTDFSLNSEEEIQKIEDKLNQRPRKRHGFLNPNTIFVQLINKN